MCYTISVLGKKRKIDKTLYEIQQINFKEERKLNTNYSENNHLVLVGKVVSDKSYSHEIYG